MYVTNLLGTVSIKGSSLPLPKAYMLVDLNLPQKYFVILHKRGLALIFYTASSNMKFSLVWVSKRVTDNF